MRALFWAFPRTRASNIEALSAGLRRAPVETGTRSGAIKRAHKLRDIVISKSCIICKLSPTERHVHVSELRTAGGSIAAMTDERSAVAPGGVVMLGSGMQIVRACGDGFARASAADLCAKSRHPG